MLYFIAKFALYLVLAGVLGVIIGWLIWGGDPFEVTSPVAVGDELEQIQELSSQLESKDQEIARLRKRLKRVHSDLDSRDSHVLAAKTTNDELQGVLSMREDELLALRRSHDSLMEQVAAGGGTIVADPQLERRLSELEEELAKSQGEARELADQLETVRAQASSGEVQHIADPGLVDEEVSRATVALRDQLAQMEAQVAAATTERQALAADLERAHGELDEAARRIVEQEAVLSAAPAGTSGDASPELSRVQAELARAKQSLSTWRSRLEEVEDENNRLAGDLAAAQAELNTNASQGGEIHVENERLTALVASIQADLATLRDQLAEREEQLAQKDAQLTEALSKAGAGADLEAENERLATELNRLRNGVLGLDERAAKAEADVVRLQEELQVAQAEGASTLSALHVELSDARLRADAAHEALQELTQEFVAFRDISARQQSSVQSLSDRIDRARTTLVGRTPLITENGDESVAAAGDDLSRLPGITKILHAHLNELGVTSFEEIGSWGDADVERYSTMLEAGDVISSNDWPSVARRYWEERDHLPWTDRVEGRLP